MQPYGPTVLRVAVDGLNNKATRVTRGAIFDVAVDIRVGGLSSIVATRRRAARRRMGCLGLRVLSRMRFMPQDVLVVRKVQDRRSEKSCRCNDDETDQHSNRRRRDYM